MAKKRRTGARRAPSRTARKAKRVGLGILAVFLIIAIIAGVGLTVFFLTQPKNVPTPNTPDALPTPPTAYTITYRAIMNGEETDVYAPLFKLDGQYPTTYKAGTAVHISDLNGRMSVSKADFYGKGYENAHTVTGAYSEGNTDYEFYGWYLDKECTREVVGFTAAEARGDKIFYAKISKVYWIGPY